MTLRIACTVVMSNRVFLSPLRRIIEGIATCFPGTHMRSIFPYLPPVTNQRDSDKAQLEKTILVLREIGSAIFNSGVRQGCAGGAWGRFWDPQLIYGPLYHRCDFLFRSQPYLLSQNQILAVSATPLLSE